MQLPPSANGLARLWANVRRHFRRLLHPQLSGKSPLYGEECEQVLEELARLETILSVTERVSQTGGWECDLQTDEWTFTEGWLRIHGCLRKQLSSAELLKIASPEDRELVQQAFNEVLQTGKSYDVEHRIIRQDDGEVRWVKAHGEAVLDAQGKPLKLIGSVQDITDDKQGKEALQLSETRWQFALEGSGDGIWDWDLPNHRMYISKQGKQLLGYSDDEIGDGEEEWTSRIHPDDFSRVMAAVQGHFEQQTEVYTCEQRLRGKDGRYKWILTRGLVIARDDRGNALRMVGTHSDINDRIEAEEEARRNTLLLEASQSIARVGGWELDLETNSLFWTSETYRIHDVSPDQFDPMVDSAVDFYVPKSRRMISEAMQDAIQRGKGYDLILEMLTAKGNPIVVRATCTVTLREGRPVKLTGILQDITVRKQAEATLRENERLYRQLFEEAPVGYQEIDASGRILNVNETELRLFGYARDEVIGHHFSEFIVEPEVTTKTLQAKLAAPSNGTETVERRIRRKDGSILDILFSHRIIVDAEGRGIGIRSSLQDITDRKAVEAELRKLSKIVEQAPLSILITDLSGTIEYANPRASETSGYFLEELLGQNPRILKSGETEPETYREMWDTLSCDKVWSGELCNRRKDGELYFENVVISPLLNNEGVTTHYAALKDDISVQKSKEAEAARKLALEQEISEMKTRFISVTSHQFRTPMAAAMGSAEILANHMDRLSSEKRAGLFARISSSLGRMTTMLDEVLLLNRIDAKRVELRTKKFDLAVFLGDVLEGVKMADADKHVFEIRGLSDMGSFVTDPNLLNHVFENLLSNAVRYSPDGSRVTVHVAMVEDHLKLTVSDEGMGIPPEDRSRIFEAFERGSNVGTIKGTGLGLNIVKRMTEMLSGTITLECPEHGGCCFTLTLPQFPES